MIIKTPTNFFLVSGSVRRVFPVNAFDGALLTSGVGDTNLVRMSSILPPNCEEIKPPPVPTAAGSSRSRCLRVSLQRRLREIISAAVAIGIPRTRIGPA